MKSIAAALENLPKAQAPDRGCKAGQDKRDSDLCAQWKAADGAAASAIWTERAFWLGMVGLAIGGLTLFFASRAAHWAKEAAKETKRSANAADGALSHARESTERQLRPYLAFSAMENIGDDDEPLTVAAIKDKTFQIQLVNFGQTPAQNVFVSTGSRYCPLPIRETNPTIHERHKIGKVAPSAKLPISFDFHDMFDDEFASVENGSQALLFRFLVEYEYAPGQTDSEDVTLFVVKEHLGRAKQGHRLTDYHRQQT